MFIVCIKKKIHIQRAIESSQFYPVYLLNKFVNIYLSIFKVYVYHRNPFV